jgi:hypothetical protein
MTEVREHVNDQPRDFQAILANLTRESAARDKANADFEARRAASQPEPIADSWEINQSAPATPDESSAVPEPEPDAEIVVPDDRVARLEDDLSQMIGNVRQLAAMLFRLDDDFRSLRAEHELLKASLPVADSSLPFHESLRDVTHHIVKLRADLFHNPKGGKGADKWKVKLFVWLDSRNGKTGTVVPFIFPLTPAADSDRYDGNAVWKGPQYKRHGISGTVPLKDHLCHLIGDICRIDLGGVAFDRDEFNANPTGVALKRWYWNKE